MELAVEPFGDYFWVEAAPLLQEEWEEVGPQGGALAPQKEHYKAAASAGRLIYVTLRDQGVLRGYFVGHVIEHSHDGRKSLVLDALFITAPARGRVGGLRLVRRAEREAKRRGATQVVLSSSIEKGQEAARLYKALGYRPVAVMYQKEI
jgi:GNAT superfamily N-acetyltransferase